MGTFIASMAYALGSAAAGKIGSDLFVWWVERRERLEREKLDKILHDPRVLEAALAAKREAEGPQGAD